MLKTPILFIIFNRPDTTQVVFDEIKKIKPKYLYVTADGPRDDKEGEREKCDAARKIIEQVNWDCEVYKNYSDVNLGCKMGVTTGIDWFFKNVEEGIILEDDCVPDQSFFYFCESLLEYYRDDKRVMQISGDNFQNGIVRGDGSYYFSKFNHLWGWATWRRAWALNDIKMPTYEEFKKKNLIASVWEDKQMQRGWIRAFDRMYNNKIDTWDYAWIYTFWSQSGLCALPNKNLVSNIGFGMEATHTKSFDSRFANLIVGEIGKITPPSFVIQDKIADNYTYNVLFKVNLWRHFGKLKALVKL